MSFKRFLQKMYNQKSTDLFRQEVIFGSSCILHVELMGLHIEGGINDKFNFCLN